MAARKLRQRKRWGQDSNTPSKSKTQGHNFIPLAHLFRVLKPPNSITKGSQIGDQVFTHGPSRIFKIQIIARRMKIKLINGFIMPGDYKYYEETYSSVRECRGTLETPELGNNFQKCSGNCCKAILVQSEKCCSNHSLQTI